mmetsp:Transcript_3295/g.6142  ORF Transcript_3295/g.6142 Transcript_3295/m.6142 type:complete len:599 (-) Transcript_3295:959-2755(-)
MSLDTQGGDKGHGRLKRLLINNTLCNVETRNQSPYERKIIACLKHFGSELLNVKVEDVELEMLVNHIVVNGESVNERANEFIIDYVEKHEEKISLRQQIALFKAAFRQIGIELGQHVLNAINQLESLVWQPKRIVRTHVLTKEKNANYEGLNSRWPLLIKHLTAYIDNMVLFRNDIQLLGTGEHNISKSNKVELARSLNKPNNYLRRFLLAVRAFLSLLRSTGMRCIEAWTLKRSDFEELACGEVLLTRSSSKCGSKRNISKRIYCKIVPHANRELCTLIHLAEYVRHVPDENAYLFLHSFVQYNPHTTSYRAVAFIKYVSVFEMLCIKVGITLGSRKVHLIRTLTTNILGEQGVASSEIQKFIGWSTSIMDIHYCNDKAIAINSGVCPYVLAGRKNDSIPPNNIWRTFSGLQGDFFEKVWGMVQRYQTCSAGGVGASTSSNLVVENAKKRKVQLLDIDICSDDETNVTATTSTSKFESQLLSVLYELKSYSTKDIFPEMCFIKVSDEIARLIEESNKRSGSNNFVLKQVTSDGKLLVKVLLLAAVYKIGASTDSRKPKSSWLTWLGKNKPSCVSTSSWSKYKDTSGIFYSLANRATL